MKALVERVRSAEVSVDGEVVGTIDAGLLVYVGVCAEDDDSDAAYVADKVARLRIFDDERGLLNLDVRAAGGRILAISAFTLCADARKGRRPSFDRAAPREVAQPLYETVCAKLSAHGLAVQRGRFGELMHVSAVNDGPICVLLDSRHQG